MVLWLQSGATSSSPQVRDEFWQQFTSTYFFPTTWLMLQFLEQTGPKWELLTTVERSTTVSHGSRCWWFFCWDEKGLDNHSHLPSYMVFSTAQTVLLQLVWQMGHERRRNKGKEEVGVKIGEKEKLRGSAGPTEGGRRGTAYSRTDR